MLKERGYTRNGDVWTRIDPKTGTKFPKVDDIIIEQEALEDQSEQTESPDCPHCGESTTPCNYSTGLRVGEPCRVMIKIFKRAEFGEWKYGTLLLSGREWKVKLINGMIVTQDDVICPGGCSKRDGENEFCVDVDGGRGQCGRCSGKGPKPVGFKDEYSCESCGENVSVLFLSPRSKSARGRGREIRRRLVGGPRARALMARLVA